ncbi:MAG: toll/interleukin-1 receptor domain-containing protein [Gemmatimonadota bacterium]
MASMAHDVFVSYSSNDQPAALAVLHGLESAGIRCWIAPRDIEPGAIWAQSIMEGIAGCRVLVVVFSAHANRSPHVINEVDAAIRKGAIVVPFRIEDVMPDGAMEYHLRTRHWLDALTPNMAEHTSQLATQVASILASHPTSAPTPTAPPRPIPQGLPPRRTGTATPTRPGFRLPTTPAGRRRLMRVGGALLFVAIATVLWLRRPHAIGDVVFTVREVSGSGNNQSSVGMTSGTLRFFEAGAAIPDVAARSYRTSFVASTTRFVDVEATLSYEAPGREITVPIGCTLTSRGGQVITTITINATIQPNWTTSVHTQGWGRSSGGFWKPDRYRADCRYGDKLIGRGYFDVTNAPAASGAAPAAQAPLAEASPWREMRAHVSDVRTFAMGASVPPMADRQTQTTFPASTTGFVGVEVTVAFDPPSRPIHALLSCRILRDRRQEIGRMTLTYDIQPGWTSAWSARGYGRVTPGSWQPGRYLAACDDGQRTLGQSPFEMQ